MRADEATKRAVDGHRLLGTRILPQPGRPCFDTEGPQEAALGHRTERVGTRLPRHRRQRGEIHMGCEVGGAGRVQHAVPAVASHRLKRIAGTRPFVPIVDDERRAAVGRDPRGEGRGQRFPRRCPLDDGAGLGDPEARSLRTRCAGGGEAERLG